MGIGASLGWRDPSYLAQKPGQERVHRFVAMLLIAQRASYVIPSAAGVFADKTPYFSDRLNVVMLASAVLWNVVLVLAVRKAGWFSRWMIAVDVAVTCVLLIVITANTPLPDRLTSAVNWSSSALFATGALLGATMPLRLLGIGLAPPALFYVLAHQDNLGDERAWFIDVLTRLNSYLWFAVILHFIARYLRGQAARLEELTRQRLAIENRQARYAERHSQFRRLHDTVLTTLTAIARGGLDHQTEQVRRRCAADAEYVRLLISSDPAGGDLTDGLAQVAASATDLGLRIRFATAAVPVELPDNVVAAMTGACQEALNNVALHSGTSDAWLTVFCEADTVTVRVVDRGDGFDAEAMPPGFGLTSSVAQRMREVGGRAEVFSMPGDGTVVDLIWPAATSAQQPVFADARGEV